MFGPHSELPYNLQPLYIHKCTLQCLSYYNGPSLMLIEIGISLINTNSIFQNLKCYSNEGEMAFSPSLALIPTLTFSINSLGKNVA